LNKGADNTPFEAQPVAWRISNTQRPFWSGSAQRNAVELCRHRTQLEGQFWRQSPHYITLTYTIHHIAGWGSKIKLL
jgi:hypothetical protein